MIKHLIWLIVGISLACITSCKTTKGIDKTERVYVYDTLIVHRVDTAYRDRLVMRTKDSIRHDSVFIVVNEKGDTIYKEVKVFCSSNNNRVDSTSQYRAKLDSLRALLAKDKETNTEVTKVVEKTNYKGWYAFGALFVALTLLIVYLIRKKTKIL